MSESHTAWSYIIIVLFAHIQIFMCKPCNREKTLKYCEAWKGLAFEENWLFEPRPLFSSLKNLSSDNPTMPNSWRCIGIVLLISFLITKLFCLDLEQVHFLRTQTQTWSWTHRLISNNLTGPFIASFNFFLDLYANWTHFKSSSVTSFNKTSTFFAHQFLRSLHNLISWNKQSCQ